MTDGEIIGLGIIVTLLLWPWEERADVIIGPPTNYGTVPNPETESGRVNPGETPIYENPEFPPVWWEGL